MNYRVFKLTFVFLLSCLFLVLQLPTVVLSEDLTGEVVGIDGNQVTVKLSTEKIPRPGDPITLILDHPDLGEMTIGQWQVTTVRYPLVEARLVEATGEPEIGVRAVIVSKNPQPAITTKPASQKKNNTASAADKALLRAVLDKSLKGVKRALKSGAAVNRVILEGSTILFAAVEMQNLAIIKYLLANGADPSIEDDFGLTALMYIPVLGGKREIETITAFHEAGVSLNSPTSTGMTLLHAAAKGWSSPETVSYLLNAGGEVNAQLKVSPRIKQSEWQGYTPLMFAVIKLEEKKVNLLLAAGADSKLTNFAGKTVLELLQGLQKSGLSLRKDFTGKRQPLADDEKKTIQAIETILLDSKVARQKVQSELQNELVRHIKANDFESVMELINLGVDLNGKVEDVPLLAYAVRYGSKDMVKTFLNHGADRLATADANSAPVSSQKEETAAIKQQGANNTLRWQRIKMGKMLTLSGGLFETGKSTLKSSAMPQFHDVITLLKSEPRNKIRIVGHTDSAGSAMSNKLLSQKRAQSVRDILVLLGIAPQRLTTNGAGEVSPIAPNGTRQGRSKNRRVEIILLEKT